MRFQLFFFVYIYVRRRRAEHRGCRKGCTKLVLSDTLLLNIYSDFVVSFGSQYNWIDYFFIVCIWSSVANRFAFSSQCLIVFFCYVFFALFFLFYYKLLISLWFVTYTLMIFIFISRIFYLFSLKSYIILNNYYCYATSCCILRVVVDVASHIFCSVFALFYCI